MDGKHVISTASQKRLSIPVPLPVGLPRCFSKRSQSGTKPRAPPNPESRGSRRFKEDICLKTVWECQSYMFSFCCTLDLYYIYICIQYIIWFSNMVESSSLYQSPDARKRCRIQECFVRYEISETVPLVNERVTTRAGRKREQLLWQNDGCPLPTCLDLHQKNNVPWPCKGMDNHRQCPYFCWNHWQIWGHKKNDIQFWIVLHAARKSSTWICFTSLWFPRIDSMCSRLSGGGNKASAAGMLRARLTASLM